MPKRDLYQETQPLCAGDIAWLMKDVFVPRDSMQNTAEADAVNELRSKQSRD